MKGAIASLIDSNGFFDYRACGHLLQHCANHSLLFQGKQIHARLILLSVIPDNFLASKLVSVYSKSGEIHHARKVFDEIPHRNIFSFNAMLIAYSSHDQHSEALRLFSSLASFKPALKPDSFTISSLLKALSSVPLPHPILVVCVLYACAELKDLAFGMEVHRSVVKSRIEMDPSVCNSVICFYAKCGSLDYARSLFDEMMERDVVSYGAMICGYMTYGFVDQAMDLFRQMESPALSTWNATISGLAQNNRHSDVLELISEMLAAGYKPNSVTLASVLPTFSFFSNLSSSKQIHCYAIRNDCDRNVYVATALIDTYAKAGFLRGAHQVFAMTKGKSVIVWTAIIYAHATHGDANTALTLFGDMLAAGTSPDPVTFTAVLSACMHAGLVEKAKGIFNSMLLEYGIQPALEHYACIAGVLARAGMLNEAVEYVCQMPIEPNAKVWGALLNGASISGNVELGRFISDRLFEIEPENTGNYIVMANIYSRTRKWEEAEKVREKMKRQGLKKVPGYSWIETGKGLQSFVSGDTLNQNREETCWMLESLSGVMRELGYVYVDELDEESVVS
ncbi:pentatricopeptide repeat-containing protein At2g37310 isoform X2 [Magnolia sinica]|uniref:pentatricopeptide repeat-containing protein At2g37310 isoform X2 n=1 Tax=Magnolia sinica TaxID=86752 RepID=UPI002657E40D|nr:pentatricopeptide repeat-containing protein At2g37310 isoform X2 [Magnolia sinica]